MLRLVGVAISVGLADSLNPSTVGPALYLATSHGRALRVSQFAIGVFTVDLLAGIVLTLGPGRALFGLVPHPRGTAKHVVELVAGAVLLAAAIGLWRARHRLARHELPGRGASGGSAVLAGGTIAAVELPTAAPYLALIAGIVASSATVPQQIGLLVLYNVAFIAPLLAILAVILLGGPRAEGWLEKGGAWLQREWPAVLASLLLVIGCGLTVLGGTGLVKQ